MALGDNTIGGRVRLDTDQFENGIAGINRSLKRIELNFVTRLSSYVELVQRWINWRIRKPFKSKNRSSDAKNEAL
ncbi:hypothetical protein BMT17_22220 [Bacillus thuringiensis serovar kurstaki]|nr:hypothetical protein BMT17_22220 [Bacillus thuringiensis serovar kurstaki]